MNVVTAVERLRSEHTEIERVLDLVEELCEAIDEGKDVEIGLAEDIVDFLVEFGDERHHAKEERILFPALEQAGVPVAGGPIGVMLSEHERGRALVGRMTTRLTEWKGGAEGAAHGWARAAGEYVALLRAHIDKENRVLFPLAERVLAPQTWADIERRFEAADARVVESPELPDSIRRALAARRHHDASWVR